MPSELQHRVLYSGVIGALVMRGLFVFAGVALLRHFRPVVFVFGGILLLAGTRMLLAGEKGTQAEGNWVVRWLARVLHVSDEFHGRHFWFREQNRWRATPLLLALIAVEVMDVVFAVDSVPAVLAVTRDSFIAYSSNAFAILGLRAMYFALASLLPKLRFLDAGLDGSSHFCGHKNDPAGADADPNGNFAGDYRRGMVLIGHTSTARCHPKGVALHEPAYLRRLGGREAAGRSRRSVARELGVVVLQVACQFEERACSRRFAAAEKLHPRRPAGNPGDSSSDLEQKSKDACSAEAIFSFESVSVTFWFCGAGVPEIIEHTRKSTVATCETIFPNDH